MYETLTRTHDPIPLLPSLKPISSAVERIKQVEFKKSKRRDIQIQEAKRKREEQSLQLGSEESSNKKRKIQGEDEEAEEDDTTSTATSTRPTTPSLTTTSTIGRKEEKEFVLKPSPYSRGHTSYLTFAVLLPIISSTEKVEKEEEEGGAVKEVEEKGEVSIES